MNSPRLLVLAVKSTTMRLFAVRDRLVSVGARHPALPQAVPLLHHEFYLYFGGRNCDRAVKRSPAFE